jgi:hypothetical protein
LPNFALPALLGTFRGFVLGKTIAEECSYGAALYLFTDFDN